MRRFTFFLIALTTTVGLVALLGPSATRADEESAAYVTDIPSGYRDWRWISSAHEAGSLNSLGAVLGNEVAIKAFRAGGVAVPGRHDHCCFALLLRPVGRKQQSLCQAQSFVPGAPTNIQFMVRDSTKYSATGGWGFGHFNASDRKPGDAALMNTCFPAMRRPKGATLSSRVRTLMLKTAAESNETMTAPKSTAAQTQKPQPT